MVVTQTKSRIMLVNEVILILHENVNNPSKVTYNNLRTRKDM